MARVKYLHSLPLTEKTPNPPGNTGLHVVYLLGHVSVCGGVKIIIEHANRLAEHGVRVTLLSHFPEPDWIEVKADYVSIPFGLELARGIPQDCDVVVATYWDQIGACVEACIAPVVYFEQGDFHLFSWEEVDEAKKNTIYNLYQLPNYIITVSETAAQKIKEIYGRESIIFHNALNEQIFFPKKPEQERFYLLAVGRDQTKFKRIHDIWQAYQRVKSKGYPLEFKWVAPNPPAEPVGDVIINPCQEELGKIYQGAWAYVCASEYESFALPVLEAMACGTPVITTPNEGVKSYAVNGENCLFFETGNCQELAATIMRLLEDPPLYQKLQANGYATAARFKWGEIIPRLVNFYQEVAGYRPVQTYQPDQWVSLRPVEWSPQEQQAIERFLSGTAADTVFMPFTYKFLDEFSIVRWYRVWQRKTPLSGQVDRLYLGFKELPVSDYPYYDGIRHLISQDYPLAVMRFREYLLNTNNNAELCVLIRWLVYSLLKAKQYPEAQKMLNKGLELFPTYTDYYHLYLQLARHLDYEAINRPSFEKAIIILGDAVNYLDYMKDVKAGSPENDKKPEWKNEKHSLPITGEDRVVALIFSKDRAMQLDGTLRSMCLHCKDINQIDIKVLFRVSAPIYQEQYHRLMNDYPSVEFIEEGNFKYQTLSAISAYRFVLFLVDDNLFVREFSVRDMVNGLDQNEDTLGFSLRLGANINYCYPLDCQQQQPEFTKLANGFLKFNWTEATHDFGYPLEVSSSLFRVNDIMRLLLRLPFTTPNTLEAYLNGGKVQYFNTKKYLLCNNRSITFCTPVNVVQNTFTNRSGSNESYSVENLSKMFAAGYRINAEKYAGFIPQSCHQEIDLEFIKISGGEPMKRKLHIGGKFRAEGWEVFNAAEADYVDHVGNARDLSRFADETFAEIYASHVLEHFDYKNELTEVLKEWRRVLQPGGKLYISVPNLDTLAHLFILKDKLTVDDRYMLMRMMFGGHVDEYDYHQVGLNYEFLSRFLKEAGFEKFSVVDNFGIFNDTSTVQLWGVPISLNVIVTK